MKAIKIFIGYDRNSRIPAWTLAESILENSSIPVEFQFLHKGSLSRIFTREFGPHDSTEFSNSRFLVPYLSNFEGYSLFIDNDMIVTGDVAELLTYIDENKTIMCVKHDHIVKQGSKFLGMPQSGYSFKNWTSVMIFNNPKCKALTPEYVNTAPGLDMHQFKWIESFDQEKDIGAIPLTWNYLCDSEFAGKDQIKETPKLIHYTEGGPFYEATQDCEYSDEWLNVYNKMNDFWDHKKSLRLPSKPLHSTKENQIVDIAHHVIELEAGEISNLSNNVDDNFRNSVEMIFASKGKVIVSGMGKSGIVGKKIAATLSSTGTPSFFLHPGEACHGDLGMIQPIDIVLLISNSGETDEILKLIPFLNSQGNKTISMSRNPHSILAKNTDYFLNISVKREACPLQLAPTSSTTATMVMGDAIAVSLMHLRDFKDANFAKFHPGGGLGKKLLMEIKDVMKTKDIPLCRLNDGMKDVVHSINLGGSGIVIVFQDGKIWGVISDGDIRKSMENEDEFFALTASDIMNKTPKTILNTESLSSAYKMMGESRVNTLIVVGENGDVLGTVQSHDVNI